MSDAKTREVEAFRVVQAIMNHLYERRDRMRQNAANAAIVEGDFGSAVNIMQNAEGIEFACSCLGRMPIEIVAAALAAKEGK